MHGGTVVAHGEGLGQEVSFTVMIPVAPLSSMQSNSVAPQVAAQAYRPIDTEQFSLAGTVVLLVEDDDDARNMLAAVLAIAHAVVETANSAEAALTLWEGIRPDRIVSDIGTPGMDGYLFIAEVCRCEKENRRPLIPAVALTAYARVQDCMRALTSGFQMHVAKPVEPAEMLTVLPTLRTFCFRRSGKR